MRRLWLGLTDIYNLFHARDLTPALVAKVSNKSEKKPTLDIKGLLELRGLHHEMDNAVLDCLRLDRSRPWPRLLRSSNTWPKTTASGIRSAPTPVKKSFAAFSPSITNVPPPQATATTLEKENAPFQRR